MGVARKMKTMGSSVKNLRMVRKLLKIPTQIFTSLLSLKTMKMTFLNVKKVLVQMKRRTLVIVYINISSIKMM